MAMERCSITLLSAALAAVSQTGQALYSYQAPDSNKMLHQYCTALAVQ
jgi:hypothetical protein